MFKPNVSCLITPISEKTSLYGEDGYGEARTVKCGVVRLEVGSYKTSVRADATASRGNASETVAMSRLLFSFNEVLKPGDRVSIQGFELEVESVYPRFTVNGIGDHLQVDLKQWASA